MENNKQWKYTGVEQYFVSDTGEVFNKKYNRFIKTQLNKSTGYIQVYIGGKTRNLHHLVCTAFHGQKPDSSFTVDHSNRNKEDNNYKNLKWVTQKENNNNRIRRDYTANRLTKSQYFELIEEYATGNHNLRTITDWANAKFKRDCNKMVYSAILSGNQYSKWFAELSDCTVNKVLGITRNNKN